MAIYPSVEVGTDEQNTFFLREREKGRGRGRGRRREGGEEGDGRMDRRREGEREIEGGRSACTHNKDANLSHNCNKYSIIWGVHDVCRDQCS